MVKVERDEQFYMTLVTIQASTAASAQGVLGLVYDVGGELFLQGASTIVGIPVQDLRRHVFTPCSRRCRGVKRQQSHSSGWDQEGGIQALPRAAFYGVSW